MMTTEKARRARVRRWRAANYRLDVARGAYVDAEKRALTALGRADAEGYLNTGALLDALQVHAREHLSPVAQTFGAYQAALDAAIAAEGALKAGDFPIRR